MERFLAGRGGRIERSAYARRLGISKSAMTHYADVFEPFDEASGLESRIDLEMPKIKMLFTKLLQEGTLDLVNGKACRSQLLGPSGLTGGSVLKRNPKLRTMLAEFDAEIQRLGYQPNHVRDRVLKLRSALASGVYDNPTTAKVHYRALRIHLGFPGDAAFPEPLLTIVREHERELKSRLEGDPLIAVRFGKAYSLRELVTSGWPETVLEAMLVLFVAAFESKRAASFHAKFNALTELLYFIAASKATCCQEVYRFMSKRVHVAGIDRSMERFVDLLEASIQSASTSPHTVNHRIDATNAVLALFNRAGILAAVRTLKRKKSPLPTPRPTTAELIPTAKSMPTIADIEGDQLRQLMIFAKEKFDLGDADVAAHFAAPDAEAFFRTIQLEFPELPAEVAADPVRAILHIVNERDRVLRVHLVALFKKWSRIFKFGQKVWKKGIDPSKYWGEDFLKNRTAIQKLFPVDCARRKFALANLLRLVRERFGGSIPNYSYPDPLVRSFFIRRCREMGGRKFLMAHLFPHKDLVGSLIALYLMESGANVAVGRTLGQHCIKDCDEDGYKIVLGNKAKAMGKPIVIFMEEDGDALVGMLWWREYRPKFLPPANGDMAQLFFSLEIGGQQKPVTEAWFLEWFSAQSSELDHFKARGVLALPSSLRPTVLMKAVLDHNGKTRHAITLAQHTSAVSSSYYARLPIRFMHEAEHRHYNEILETIALHRLPDGRAFIGATAADFERRLEEFEPTGLGTHCGNPLGCETFDCWHCENSIVIVEPESVAPLIAWSSSLAEAEGDWVRDHPERWEEFFVGWQVFIKFAEETMQQSHLVDIWDAATLIADEAMSRPDYRPYQPWS